MEGLKLVPQVFFDAIGRGVPGAVALAMFFLSFGAGWWRDGLRAIVGQPEHEYPPVLATLVLVFLSYLIGQLVSPLTKVVQRAGERRKGFKEASATRYEWLRVHNPDVGALCAKLRAEFTMYNGLAAVFVLYSVVSPWTRLWHGVLGGWVLLLLLPLATLMAYRGWETYGTFRKSIDLLYEAAGGP